MEESSTDELEHELVRGWLIKAHHDLATANKLAAGPDSYLDTAIYHCQQAAEKSVKGFLTFHGQRVVRTHDVRYLLTLAIPFDESLSACLESAERVTPYATAYRYPDEILEPEEEEFEAALAAAEEICACVLSALPKEVHPTRSEPHSQDETLEDEIGNEGVNSDMREAGGDTEETP